MSEKETLLTRFQMQIKVKESEVNRANIFCRKKLKQKEAWPSKTFFLQGPAFNLPLRGMSVGNLAFSTSGHNVTVNGTWKAWHYKQKSMRFSCQDRSFFQKSFSIDDHALNRIMILKVLKKPRVSQILLYWWLIGDKTSCHPNRPLSPITIYIAPLRKHF